jgi:hypothetical protein
LGGSDLEGDVVVVNLETLVVEIDVFEGVEMSGEVTSTLVGRVTVVDVERISVVVLRISSHAPAYDSNHAESSKISVVSPVRHLAEVRCQPHSTPGLTTSPMHKFEHVTLRHGSMVGDEVGAVDGAVVGCVIVGIIDGAGDDADGKCLDKLGAEIASGVGDGDVDDSVNLVDNGSSYAEHVTSNGKLDHVVPV